MYQTNVLRTHVWQHGFSIHLFISNVNKDVAAQNIRDYIKLKSQATVFVPEHKVEMFLTIISGQMG